MIATTLLRGIPALAVIWIAASHDAAALPITGSSPIAACTLDSVAPQPGTNYLNAEVEPWVDVDPGDGNRVIAGWQQDRWSNGGARGPYSATSDDGGVNWTLVEVPGITLCTGGQYQRASDPWVGIAADGTAYFLSLAFMNDAPSGAIGANALLVNRSTDGGQSWGEPVTLIADDDSATLNDKNALTADPRDSHFVYATWDRFTNFTLVGPVASKNGPAPQRPGDGVVAARERLRELRARSAAGITPQVAEFTGPTWFARTIDGGASWEPAHSIYETGPDAQTIGNQAVNMPNGAVLVFFTDISASGATDLGFVRSGDHGASFGPRLLATHMNVTSTGTRTPDAHAHVRDGNLLFDVAVDPQNGNLYAVWQDGRWGGIDRVAFSMSNNKGASWSAPVRINRTPLAENLLRNQAMAPSVAVGADRRVYVTYYDFRNDLADGNEMTDYWAISCDPVTANCRLRASWGSEIRLTSASFDMQDAPVARGHFLGDYQGLARRGTRMIAVFGVATSANRTNIIARVFK